MTCPSCGAPMTLALDSFHCDYCRSIVFPSKDDDGVRLLAEASETTCPVCSIKLHHAALSRLPLFSCTRCRGMAISMEVLPLLLKCLRAEQGNQTTSQSQADPRGLSRSIHCPQCHRAMEAHFYAGPGNVILDSCETCALNWFDHGELKRIVLTDNASMPTPAW